MRDLLFQLKTSEPMSLQAQLREKLVSAILGGQIPGQERMPSSRQLARALGISRNTVTLVYQSLIDDGFLVARERSGYFVTDNEIQAPESQLVAYSETPVDWTVRFRVRPTRQTNINKPLDWPSYPYPFIYGQVDHRLFPIAEWRECSRQALGTKWLDIWTADSHGNDDPMLVEQIRTRLLPPRGIMAQEDEILVTIGAQHALYLIASLLVSRGTRVGIEDPGYPDVRNILSLRTDEVLPIPVDSDGLMIDERMESCDLVYTTPSHQAPTTVTMPEERRYALLEAAARNKVLVIEDDYEFETNYVRAPSPALKSIDRSARVIYVGSLSKTLFPGLRLGYLVADREFIDEARALRRLMVRHPPSNSQRTAALFLALGHHDALIMRLRRAYKERWHLMEKALAEMLPQLHYVPSVGGTSYWVNGPDHLDARLLAQQAQKEGLLLEPGDIYFAEQPAPQNYFRLGFSSISAARIKPGIRRLAKLVHRQQAYATSE